MEVLGPGLAPGAPRGRVAEVLALADGLWSGRSARRWCWRRCWWGARRGAGRRHRPAPPGPVGGPPRQLGDHGQPGRPDGRAVWAAAQPADRLGTLERLAVGATRGCGAWPWSAASTWDGAPTPPPGAPGGGDRPRPGGKTGRRPSPRRSPGCCGPTPAAARARSPASLRRHEGATARHRPAGGPPPAGHGYKTGRPAG